MKFRTLFWLCFLTLTSCRTSAGQHSETESFFKNSYRRDATLEEASHVAKLSMGCTGYFIRNTANKILIGLANHCVIPSGGADTWCKTHDGFTINGVSGNIKTDSNEIGNCKGVVLNETGFDIMIVEADFSNKIDSQRALLLAGYDPKVFTPLKMIGYPSDKSRLANLSVTDHCWILKSDLPSPQTIINLKDSSALHNCSTYGGNSGGPMLREGSLEVVGLPFTYEISQDEQHDATNEKTAAYVAKMSGFVARNRKVLDDLGVTIVDKESDQTPITWAESPVQNGEFLLTDLGVHVKEVGSTSGQKGLEVTQIDPKGLLGVSGLTVGEVLILLGSRSLYSIDSFTKSLAEISDGIAFNIVTVGFVFQKTAVTRELWLKKSSQNIALSSMRINAIWVNYGEDLVPGESIALAGLGITVQNSSKAPNTPKTTAQILTVTDVSKKIPAPALGLEKGDLINADKLNVRDFKRNLEEWPAGSKFPILVVRGNDVLQWMLQKVSSGNFEIVAQ